MTANFDKTYLVKQFSYFGAISYLFGYIVSAKDEPSLLPLVIMFGIVSLCYLCMWIGSFFGKAIELKEQIITISFLFSKKRYPISSFLDVDLDKKQIYFLNDKGKKITYTLKWVVASDLLKLKEIIKT